MRSSSVCDDGTKKGDLQAQTHSCGPPTDKRSGPETSPLLMQILSFHFYSISYWVLLVNLSILWSTLTPPNIQDRGIRFLGVPHSNSSIALRSMMDPSCECSNQCTLHWTVISACTPLEGKRFPCPVGLLVVLLVHNASGRPCMCVNTCTSTWTTVTYVRVRLCKLSSALLLHIRLEGALTVTILLFPTITTCTAILYTVQHHYQGAENWRLLYSTQTILHLLTTMFVNSPNPVWFANPLITIPSAPLQETH